MNNLARTKLADIVNNYGTTVCNTPRSCEIFLQQYCDDLPAEREVLTEALRRGVVTRLMEEKEQPYQLIASSLVKELQADGIAAEDARWAVESWALALGKHPSTAPPPPAPVPAFSDPQEEQAPPAITSSKVWSPLVVALGGGIGAILATLVFTFLFYTLLSNPHGSHGVRSDSIALLLGIVMALAGAVGGGLGGGVGWLLIQLQTIPVGSPDAARWRLARGFLAACGGAFGATLFGGWFGGVVGIALGGLMGAFSGTVVSGLRG
jgi:hypothetical protein